MWIKSCISSLLATCAELPRLCVPLKHWASSRVCILPSHCYVVFFNGKRSGILVYRRSGEGNLFCHVTSKIKVDVVTSRDQLSLPVHIAKCSVRRPVFQ